MKITIFILGLFCTFSVKAQQGDNRLAPDEFAEGWELLFDGETLNGWKAYNGDVPKILES